MVSWSPYQAVQHEAKLFANKKGKFSDAAEKESILRERILDYCSHQWPRWLVISCRTDKASTIAVGAHDCTIFAPKQIFCLEFKSRTGKLSSDQQAWAFEMQKLGHTVHVIRSFQEFLLTVQKGEK